MAFKSLIGATCTCLAAVSFSADAALIGRLAATPGGTDYQAYYDDVADLTWLADANYAQTSGYAAYGFMTWANANAWAASLDVAGVTGWRLPDTLQPDASCRDQLGGTSSGLNCTGSEMGDIFHNALGNTTSSLTNAGPFSNVQSSHYWSATEYAPSTGNAWYFNMGNGLQGPSSKTIMRYAWAVQSGDVSAVPVPAAAWLFGSGLIGLIGVARRKS